MSDTIDDTHLSLTETCRALDVSEPTLRRWINSGCPVVERGSNGKAYRLDLDAVRDWRAGVDAEIAAEIEARERQIAAAQSTLDLEGGRVGGVDALSSKARREFYDAEAARIKVAKDRGELCYAVEVQAEFDRVFRFLADRLQALPDHLERRCNLSQGAVAEVSRAVDEWQSELARKLQGSLDNAA